MGYCVQAAPTGMTPMCTRNGLRLCWNTQTRQARGRAFCIQAAPMTQMCTSDGLRPPRGHTRLSVEWAWMVGIIIGAQTVIAHNGRMSFERWGPNDGGKGSNAGQTAGARQVLKQSPTWVLKNIAKQHWQWMEGGFQTDDERPGFLAERGFLIRLIPSTIYGNRDQPASTSQLRPIFVHCWSICWS